MHSAPCFSGSINDVSLTFVFSPHSTVVFGLYIYTYAPEEPGTELLKSFLMALLRQTMHPIKFTHLNVQFNDLSLLRVVQLSP